MLIIKYKYNDLFTSPAVGVINSTSSMTIRLIYAWQSIESKLYIRIH